MKIPSNSQCDQQCFVGLAPLSHFIIGLFQLSVSFFLILSILRRKWFYNFSMATSWVKYILPIYLPFIWMILILIGLIGFHSLSGFYIINPYFSLGKWFLLRVLSDSLTIFLHHTGIGLKSGRKSITIGFFHSLFLGLIHLLALCLTKEDDQSSVILPIQLGITLELLLIYLIILVLPISKLHRRPAVYRLAFGITILLSGSVCLFFLKIYHFDIKKDADLDGKFIGGCEVELFLALIDFFQLILILHTFLLDSKFWQGLYSDSRVNLNEPLQGIWDMDRDTINLVADSAIMLEKKVVPIIPFSKLKVDTKKFFSGGTARVYKGNLANNPDEVAIKFLFCIELTPDRIVEFINEATILNSLQHPNIVKCYGVAIMPPAISLITEFCSYGSLFDFLHSTSIIKDEEYEIYDENDIYYDENFFTSNSRKSNSHKKSYRIRTNTEDLSKSSKKNYFSSLIASFFSNLTKKKKGELLLENNNCMDSNSNSHSYNYYENTPLPSLPLSENSIDNHIELEDEIFSSSISTSLRYNKNNSLNYLVEILENNESLEIDKKSIRSSINNPLPSPIQSPSISLSLISSTDNRSSITSDSLNSSYSSNTKKKLSGFGSNYRLEQHHHILASPTATSSTVTNINRRTLPVNNSFSTSLNPMIKPHDNLENTIENIQETLKVVSCDSQSSTSQQINSHNTSNAVTVLSSPKVYASDNSKFKSPRTILFTREMGFGLGPIANKKSTPRAHSSLPSKLQSNNLLNLTNSTLLNGNSTQSNQDIESGYLSGSTNSVSDIEFTNSPGSNTPSTSYRKHLSQSTSYTHASASISTSIPLSKHHLDSLLLSNTNNKKFFYNNKKNEKILGNILPLSTRLSIIRDCAAGLAYLHEKNFMHCDIKSLNFLVTNNLTVKLADLGEARMVNTKKEEIEENEKSLPSNINWSSPETLIHAMQTNQILLQNKKVDQESLPVVSQSADIWSLAMVMSEILSAQVPFDSEDVRLLSLESFLEKLKDGLRPEISPEYQHISWLMELINSSWKYDPDERITSSQIVKKLDDIINQS